MITTSHKHTRNDRYLSIAHCYWDNCSKISVLYDGLAKINLSHHLLLAAARSTHSGCSRQSFFGRLYKMTIWSLQRTIEVQLVLYNK